MSRPPDVSVVIPTRDRPGMLLVALLSATDQRDVDVEVLVVDDGTAGVAREVAEAVGDPRVEVLASAGSGVSATRNTGIAAAGGRWVAFLDDDDAWAPDKLAAQLAAVTEARSGWAYAGFVTADAQLRVCEGSPPPPPEDVMSWLRRYDAVPAGASGVLVRRDVIDGVGPFDPSLETSEDWDMWLRLGATGAPACTPRPLVALRRHRGMASRDLDRVLADLEVVAARHGILVDRARHRRWAAWMALEDGRRADAVRRYAAAVREGDVVSIGRAVVALLRPGVARPPCRGGTTAWTLDAQRWCDRLLARAAEFGSFIGEGRAPWP